MPRSHHHGRAWPRVAAATLALVLLAGVSAAPAAGAAGPVGVVASIRPVHSLVAGVTGEVAQPVLVVRGYGSPHTYQLRPTLARALGRARAVFWIGPALETFLAGTLERRQDTTAVVTLGDVAGLVRHPTRAGGAWPGPGHDSGHARGTPETTDMHLWLDVGNARRMVDVIASELARVDPEHAGAYRRNGERLGRRLELLDQELQAVLAPVRHLPYVVLHDAFQYLEQRYGLNPVGSVLVSPERAPSARRLRELRARVRESGARCVFGEPQFESALVGVVIEGTGARAGVLDSLGAGLEPGPDAYFEMMRANARSIAACLGDK